MADEEKRVYCNNCGCYLGDAPRMLHDEYGRPTYQVAFCSHCGAEIDGSGTPSVNPQQIAEWFEACWKLYPRHEGKVMARRTFESKLPRQPDEAHKMAVRIYRTIDKQKDLWDEQNRELQYMPYFSSWLNANFENIRKIKRGKSR